MTDALGLQRLKECFAESATTRRDIEVALDRFGEKRVLMVGDLIIDIYTECSAIGKTAKTPTLSVKKGPSRHYWGGSSLIANNLLAMGGHVTLVAVTGDDWGHDYYAQRKHERLTSRFFKDKTRPTTVKERYWVDGYKLLQVDTVENHDIPKALEDEIYGTLEASAPHHDLLLIADNRHGTMTHGLIGRIKTLGQRTKLPMVVDTQVSSRWGNLEQYENVAMICVNENEARFYLRDERAPIEEIRERLVKTLKPERLLLKLKDKGMIGWDREDGDFWFPAIPVKPVDPIGAGDAFLSAAALSFDPQTKLPACMYIASCAGAIAVTKMGTDPSTYEEIRSLALQTLDQIEL